MKKVLIVVSIVCLIILAACNVSSVSTVEATLAPVPIEYAGKTNPLGPEAAADGAKIFKANCTPCHGAEGHGDGPAGAALDPAPKNLADLQAAVGDDYLFWRINTGKPGTSMVAWKGILSDEEIWQVVAFIHTLK